MSKRLCSKIFSESDCSDAEEPEAIYTSRDHFKTDRRTCPHCHQLLSLKTYRAHKRLFYNEVRHIMCKVTRAKSEVLLH